MPIRSDNFFADMISLADLKVKIIVTQFRKSNGNKVFIVENVFTFLEKYKDMIYIGHFYIGTFRNFIPAR